VQVECVLVLCHVAALVVTQGWVGVYHTCEHGTTDIQEAQQQQKRRRVRTLHKAGGVSHSNGFAMLPLVRLVFGCSSVKDKLLSLLPLDQAAVHQTSTLQLLSLLSRNLRVQHSDNSASQDHM
jgi:hypothetical protein